ncbi:Zona pellucida sperm-binding protein 3 [Merluccius polli]|uniref:Zona pellucida sperm-binding protein 3 n=1 Tax=Merluccius polli TaxID=89951 RepID=A0AA47MZQ1_MERPO|nr:Zona pellucida sperm-binding protein 3 [Merluccius polli]
MATALYRAAGIVLAVVASAAANADIKIDCLKDAVNITWTIPLEFMPHATRFFLGRCIPTDFAVLPTGEHQVYFNYKYMDCQSRRRLKGKNVIYQNELTYRPKARPVPADFTYPVECHSHRDHNKWIPKFTRPGLGIAEGRGELVFHMALLNADLSGISQSNEVPLGSMLPIWAAVEQKSHQPMLLLMDECEAVATPDLQPGTQYYPLVGNQGCLLASKWGHSVFLPRYHSSALVLYLQTFKLAFSEEVYINCRLVAWDPARLSQDKKACNYVKETGSWELLDDVNNSHLCSCCDSPSCTSRHRRETGSGGVVQNVVLGPLRFVDPVLLLSLVAAAVLVDADMKLDCTPDAVTLVWTETRSQRDLSLLRLGSCPPTSISTREAVFSVEFGNCNFRRKVTKDELEYSNDLTYASSENTKATFSYPVACTFERTVDWHPPIYDPALLQTYGEGALVFSMELMNDDFSGPAPSRDFALGSLIPIKATVAQVSHQPLLLLLDDCVATPTPDLRSDSNVYPIISNHGCLMDSKVARSRFEPRLDSSELRMSVQAFRFALGTEVYIHCTLNAWDPNALDQSKKACHHVAGNGWEFLDDPSYNSLCGCCDTSCTSRKTRSTSGGIKYNAVLGPVKFVDKDA